MIMKAIHNIEPIYSKNSKILILGSMPSVISRQKNFYYAHKTNRFWKIIENLFNVQLNNELDKKYFLLKNHIALWDVIKSCDIDASNDASIKNVVPNDINMIINNSRIQCIFCTGKKSYNLFKKYFNTNIKTICLPSPSSANAKFNLQNLIGNYKIILDELKK